MYRRKSGDKTRKVTPPSPSYMDSDQFAAYLKGLRNNRIARPGGARPLPTPPSSQPSGTQAIYPETESSSHPGCAPSPHAAFKRPTCRHSSINPQNDEGRQTNPPTPVLRASDVVPSAIYMDRGQRWMEKEEAGSLRHAMEDMAIRDTQKTSALDNDEQRVYDAALEEASELVWQHRNGQEPQPNAAYRYKSHMRKNSYQHARAVSIGKPAGDSICTGPSSQGPGSLPRTSMDSDNHSRGSHFSVDLRWSGSSENAPSRQRSSSGQSTYGSLSRTYQPANNSGNRRSSMKRNISGEVERPFCGDQIWEEPEAGTGALQRSAGSPHKGGDSPLGESSRNQPLSSAGAPQGDINVYKTRSQIEIQQNIPSQSRNPQYKVNVPRISVPGIDDIATKRGMEIRNDDIRNATSMKLGDRSAKLLTPSAVSDNPGRPIVSFDADWKPPEETTDQTPESACHQSSPRKRGHTNNSMAIPTIMVASEDDEKETTLPRPSSRSIHDEESHGRGNSCMSVPVITIPDDGDNDHRRDSPSASRPLPIPSAASAHSRLTRRPRSHWSPAPGNGPRSATLCHECGLPIEGRFVSLAGVAERFHPRCFRCFACGTGLEALEISPEPETYRNERLDRIRRRTAGEILEEVPGMTTAEDGDDRLRFFCHLDWHELFAPRCKHCKTPILGEHIVALGEHWHYGHFFCAECGDPFERGMTHIEKDGYAWCINCQTKRTERRAPKCKMCKAAVIGQYIQALGGEWHDECFRCAHCRGGFDDGQIFPKEELGTMVVLCTECRVRELKA